jgi:hypothetical protein
MSMHIIPTPHEINAVIFDMIAAEAAQMPDDTSLNDLWSSWPWIGTENFEAMASDIRRLKRARAHGSPPGGRSVTCVSFRAWCRWAGGSRSTRLWRGRCSGRHNAAATWDKSWGYRALHGPQAQALDWHVPAVAKQMIRQFT